MRAVLDTNVVVSGVFFGGVPKRVLERCFDGEFECLVTPDIADEYLRTFARLGSRYPELEYGAVLGAILGQSTLVAESSPGEPITADPADDKFMLCARDQDAVVVSGDRHLLDVDGWMGVRVVTPRDFLALLDEASVDEE